MAREVETLKRRLADPGTDRARLQELLLRLVYVEMLGHPAGWGHIHAVKATHEAHVGTKRVGYLATGLFLEAGHDLLILTVNTLQTDLRSDSALVVAAALGAAARLATGDSAAALLPGVVCALGHPTELVRKKAVMALHRFWQRSPGSVAHLVPRLRAALCDKDPSVMVAALCALHDVARPDPGPLRNLVPSLVSILGQVLERRLPKANDHPRGARALPAPFVQVKLLKCLATLAAGDAAASAAACGVVGDALRLGDNGTTMGSALVTEAVKTAAALASPPPALLAAAADAVAKFLRSRSNNLKYAGIEGLTDIVAAAPHAAAQHQAAVIDCLEDADDTLRAKTLTLLYRMAGPHNVAVIAGRMLGHARAYSSGDDDALAEACARVAELAERYAPDDGWYVATINAVFELGGRLVKPALAHDLVRLIQARERERGRRRARACPRSRLASSLALVVVFVLCI